MAGVAAAMAGVAAAMAGVARLPSVPSGTSRCQVEARRSLGRAAMAPNHTRHDPSAAALHGLVRRHLATFLDVAAERSGRPLPRYVAEEFRAYLRCGLLAHGFARARCAGCGHELLVAFSCKLRGVCPSCGGRRMSATAAHLTDRVLPEVPLRQWVLSRAAAPNGSSFREVAIHRGHAELQQDRSPLRVA